MAFIRRAIGLLPLLILLTACSSTEPTASECVVSVPGEDPFVPPAPWPATPPVPQSAWFGSDDLWTIVATEGEAPRKSVWWSANFADGSAEPAPDIEVVYRRLDVDAEEVTFPSPGTNAFTNDVNWFMINGLEPDDPGCWQGTATYRGTTLSYTYEVG
ncbi:MAG: hypothetical protein ACRBK7_30200 [Acidimicrobiales bacterium]